MAAAKAPGIPKVSLSNRVRLAAKGKLDGGDVTGIHPSRWRLRVCAPRLRVLVWSAPLQKKPRRSSRRTRREVRPDTTK